MASVNRVILVGNWGRDEFRDEFDRALAGYAAVLQRASTGWFDAVAFQEACRTLNKALKALRGSRAVAPITGFFFRAWTFGRASAFFHGRKVDGRNLP